jgi:hypothetical protein
MKRLVLVTFKLSLHRVERRGPAEQKVSQHTRIDDDHRRSRASRMIAALDGPVYGVRVRIRSASSGTVGRAASSFNRASRNSFNDWPASAACDRSRRCTSSGTARI